MYELVFYKTKTRRQPFKKWLNKLKDSTAEVLIYTKLDRLSLGHSGNYKLIAQGLFEMKITLGPGYRIYYGKCERQKLIILLNAGTKNTQVHDIKKAKIYWNTFTERYKND